MTNLASLLKAEISRVARKEIRAEIESLRKASAQHRSHIAALRRQVQDLERALRHAAAAPARGNGRSAGAAAVADSPADDDGPRRRFSPKRLASHRTKLGLSAAAYGQLVGVSGQTIYNWEQGQARPRAEQLNKLVAVRTLTRATAAAQLQG